MKIILVEGPPNSGKTTLINEVFNTLRKEISTEDVIMPYDNHVWDNDDFQAVVRKNGKTIGFYSMGDIAHQVIAMIYVYAVRYECDILVIASRNFATVDLFLRNIGQSTKVELSEPYSSKAIAIKAQMLKALILQNVYECVYF